ncbi:NAD(P)-dependent oxidoreductase [Enterococcus sp. LJL98]
MKIGFIGIGVMGHSIVSHLLAAGHDLTLFTRTKRKALDLIEQGADWRETPREVAEASQIIFTMVGYPSDVEQTYFSEQTGLLAADVTNKILVDLTTSTPSLAEKIHQAVKQKGGQSLDAPVSGGDLGAKNGTLTVMVGGETAVYQEVLPIFQLFSQTSMLHGGAGKGQHTKMANQIMIAGTMTGMTEMLAYSKASGLNLEKVIATLSGGAASNWSMIHYGPRILKEDYSPGFFVKHFIKDLKIALDEAAKLGVHLPGTQLAKELYEKLAGRGAQDDGTQALIKLWWQETVE